MLLALALLALSEADQHLLTTGVVGLLFALSNYVTVKVVTAQQTRRIVGDPNGKGRRVGLKTEDVSLATNTLALADIDTKVNTLSLKVSAVDRKIEAVDAKAVQAATLAAEGATLAAQTNQAIKEHADEDTRRFAILIPPSRHEEAGLPRPKTT